MRRVFAFGTWLPQGLVLINGSCLNSPHDARSVFYGIEIRNSISWNSIISIYSRRGVADISAFELFSSMATRRPGIQF